MIDKIIVTGCSFSCGCDMANHLINDPAPKNKTLEIMKWYKRNNGKISVGNLADSYPEFLQLEKNQYSWPALLQQETGINVINLASHGSSIGRSLVEFSNYLGKGQNENTVAIHQLPLKGRFYMKFLGKRKNLVNGIEPGHGYNKKFYRNAFIKLEQDRKKLIMRDIDFNYIDRQYQRCLQRIEKLGIRNKIPYYFIGIEGVKTNPNLIDNFDKFREQYDWGKGSHPVDPRFNRDIVDIIIKYLKLRRKVK